MGTKFMDHTMRWILIIACVLLLCMGALLILDTVVSQQEDAPSASILSVPEQDMRIYARVQKETGIPWVVLCAIDRAEDVSPDLARARTVADVLIQAGAIERGLTIGPITNAADLAGLYTTDRKKIARISREILSLEDLYLIIQSGRFPADGGTVIDEADGCRITGAHQVRSPFSATVVNAQGGVVDVNCDNGLSVHITGVETIRVAAGDVVSAGEILGNTTSFFLSFWYGNAWVHAYPYITLWDR